MVLIIMFDMTLNGLSYQHSLTFSKAKAMPISQSGQDAPCSQTGVGTFERRRNSRNPLATIRALMSSPHLEQHTSAVVKCLLTPTQRYLGNSEVVGCTPAGGSNCEQR